MANIKMNSLAGQLLIANAEMMDPNFAKSVVLIVKHDEEGALGLILNRALPISVRKACEPMIDSECAVEGMLYRGGPCDGPLAAVHSQEHLSDIEISPGLHFAVSRDKLEELLAHPEGDTKFFAHYAGWGAGQLELEMQGQSWLLLTARPDHVFADEGDELWERALRELALSAWVKPEQIPDDPSLN